MTAITEHADHATLINVFTVQPDRARQLRVVNYAQWRSAEAFQAMLQNETAQEHMAHCAALADGYDPHLYTVESVHSAR
jgi:quinol monooxygenase YgiN